jgi:predicted transcriptional regulator
MSLSQFSIYVDRLTEGGLLRKYVNDKGKKIYETTKKGKDFLRDYEKIKKTLDQANM